MPEYTHRAVARVSLQTEAPLSIATGLQDGLFDTALARDANDLPLIPGTSVAGVLRHLYRHVWENLGPEQQQSCLAPEQLFGFTGKNHDEGQASRLELSFGYVHDSTNRSVEGVCLHRDDDPLLKWLAQTQPVTREGVAINARGAAVDQAKFDRAVAPKGIRFSLQLAMWNGDSAVENNSFDLLLALFQDPRFRLGGKTRSGFGQVSVVSMSTRNFNLAYSQGGTDDYSAYAALPAQLSDHAGLNAFTVEPPETDLVALKLVLEPDSFWRMGAGNDDLKRGERPADIRSWLEPVVGYVNGSAKVKGPVPVLAASGLKGAIAHRVVYHYNCIVGNFARSAEDIAAFSGSQNPAIKGLFGYANESVANQQQGQAGHLWFSDTYVMNVEPETMVGRQMHNKIDRFTGGTINGALYEEELLYKTQELTTTIVINKAAIEGDNLLLALQCALNDLVQGRLSLGGGASKGHGYFHGRVEGIEQLEVAQ